MTVRVKSIEIRNLLIEGYRPPVMLRRGVYFACCALYTRIVSSIAAFSSASCNACVASATLVSFACGFSRRRVNHHHPHFDAIAIGHTLALVLEVVVIAVVLNAEVSSARMRVALIVGVARPSNKRRPTEAAPCLVHSRRRSKVCAVVPFCFPVFAPEVGSAQIGHVHVL